MSRPPSRGQALAEFAIVLPVFLLILLAVFDVGRAVFIYNGLTNSAREAARLAIVNQDKPSVAARAQDMSFGTTVTTTPANLVRFYRALPNSDDVTANPVCDPPAVGCMAVVKADTTWTAITPIIGNLIGPITLTARSELPVEFVCPNPAFAAYQTPDSCPRSYPEP
jgi:Flp pilus assembly protein TadG